MAGPNRPKMHWTASLLLWIVILSFHGRQADGMECFCSRCSLSSSYPPPLKMCSTEGSCFIKVTSSGMVRQGCLPATSAERLCNTTTSSSKLSCCHGNLCNGMPRQLAVGRRLLAAAEDNMSVATPDDYASERSLVIVLVVCIPVTLMVLIIALLISLLLYLCLKQKGCYCCCRSGNLEEGRSVLGNQCLAIVPPHMTLPSMLDQQRSALSPSLSLLVQEAIVQRVVLERLIRRGTFSESYVGSWRKEKVHVCVYPELHKQLFYSESHLYQIPHMCHPNIKTFVAAQNRRQTSNVVNKYLITQHYERGTLADHLGGRPALDISEVVLLAYSAASGLAHLHQEVRGEGARVEKEAIAHRNINSHAFWIKNDGTCCLGDLSLAVKDDRDFQSNLGRKPLGHTHYLSPELLDCSSSNKGQEAMTFEVLKKADVYAFGLVMWEIARRCVIRGMVENAELPFAHIACGEACQGACPSIATLEQMRVAVLTRRLRPPLADYWSMDNTMQSYVDMFLECWNEVADLRPCAMAVKNSLDNLRSSCPLNLPSHKDTEKSPEQQQ